VLFFLHNNATRGGAIICLISSTFNLTGAYFWNNTASNEGGALWIEHTISNSQFYLMSSSFTVNKAVNHGGAAYFNCTNYNGSQVFTNIKVENNSAQIGGGFYHYLSNATIQAKNSTFNYNMAINGGAWNCDSLNSSHLNFTGTTFYDNMATSTDCYSTNLSGNCSGIFSLCTLNSPAMSCFNCTNQNCQMSSNNQTYCISSAKGSGSCSCFIGPPKSLSLIFIITICAIAVIGCIIIFAICRTTQAKHLKGDYKPLN